jgi:hypothetical protein
VRFVNFPGAIKLSVYRWIDHVTRTFRSSHPDRYEMATARDDEGNVSVVAKPAGDDRRHCLSMVTM